MTDTERRPIVEAEVDDVRRAALSVPGVLGVRVHSDADGVPLLRLELASGVDEDEVARALEERLAAVQAGAAGTAPLTAPHGVPAQAPPSEPVQGATSRSAARPRTGRTSVPPVTAPTVAATPAPQWLGVAPGAEQFAEPHGRSAPERATEHDAVDAAPQGAERLRLERVAVVTEGFTTTATVTLVQDGRSFTGVADSAATAAGGHRSLASAALRAVESAVGGRVRAEVDAVSIGDLGGQRTATVLLSVASPRGSEQLVGAGLAGDDPSRAVVVAVLSACNRRVLGAPPACGR